MDNAFIYLNPTVENFEQMLAQSISAWRNTESGKTRRKVLMEAHTPEQIQAAITEARKESLRRFKEFHYGALNDCLTRRYRKNEHTVVHVLQPWHRMPPEIETPKKTDYVLRYRTSIQGAMSDEEFILCNFKSTKQLRIGGFYLWDEVERLAAYAWKAGKNVMVDEDITDLFATHILQRSFQRDRFPGTNPRDLGWNYFERFMTDRSGKPWLFQDY